MPAPAKAAAADDDDDESLLTTAGYWDARYEQSDGEHPTHEWLKTFAALEPFLQRHLFDPRGPAANPRILHLGSGDSTIPHDLAARGYANQLCVDFSPVAVELMAARHGAAWGGAAIEWRWADVRGMADVVPDASVDVAFDKSTLDAMIYGSPWDPPAEVVESTGRYVGEVFRVLKPDGVFIAVSFRQMHFMRPILNRDGVWDLRVEELVDGKSSFGYYAYILTKKKEEKEEKENGQGVVDGAQ